MAAATKARNTAKAKKAKATSRLKSRWVKHLRRKPNVSKLAAI